MSRRARWMRKSSPPEVVHESRSAILSPSNPSATSCERASLALLYVPESLDDMVMHSTSEPPSRRRRKALAHADWKTASVPRILPLRKSVS